MDTLGLHRLPRGDDSRLASPPRLLFTASAEQATAVQHGRCHSGLVIGFVTAQRQVLYLEEINASQCEAWRKPIEVHDGVGKRQVALFPAGGCFVTTWTRAGRDLEPSATTPCHRRPCTLSLLDQKTLSDQARNYVQTGCSSSAARGDRVGKGPGWRVLAGPDDVQSLRFSGDREHRTRHGPTLA